MNLIEKFKEAARWMNEHGIPLPMLRDPKTGASSVSLTMMFIAFNVVLVGLVGKWSKKFDGIDVQQALYWFLITASLYFGRNLSTGGKTISNTESDSK